MPAAPPRSAGGTERAVGGEGWAGWAALQLLVLVAVLGSASAPGQPYIPVQCRAAAASLSATNRVPRKSLLSPAQRLPHAVLDTLIHGVLPPPVPPPELERPQLRQRIREMLQPQVGGGAHGWNAGLQAGRQVTRRSF